MGSHETEGASAPRKERLIREAKRGIEACRRDRWDEGLRVLKSVARFEGGREHLPSLFHSYLGYALACKENRYEEGVQLCEQAIGDEFFQPENYLNLARIHLLREKRRDAIVALDLGLRIDPEHGELLALHGQLGWRERAVLPLLPRGHFLNQILGRLRGALRSAKGSQAKLG